MLRRLTAAAAALVPLILAVVTGFLALYAGRAIRFNGVKFFTTSGWSIGNQYVGPIRVHGILAMPGMHFGILFLIVGTLASAALALLFAFVLGIGATLFLTEIIPERLARPLSSLVELLAAIPSVVYGLWGIVFLAPFLARHVYPLCARLGALVPFLGRPIGAGYGLLTSALILTLMIVPFITAILRDALLTVPPELREAAVSLGATRFEVAGRVLLRGQGRTLVGAGILALGRALGETMAVLMVSGNALNTLPERIYSPISTMAAFIAAQLDSALGDQTGLAVRSLAEIALVLLVISVLTNSLSRLLLRTRPPLYG
jgi:phosphate transport system permease protein